VELIRHWQLALLLFICVILRSNWKSGRHLGQLRRELRGVFPGFAAETTRSTEAGFIGQPLRGQFLVWLCLSVALGLCLVVLWLWR
jgi:hypothetical protein